MGDEAIGSLSSQVASTGMETIKSLEKDIADLLSTDGEIDQKDMIQLQLLVGQYTTMSSTISNIVSSLAQSAKEAAQNC